MKRFTSIFILILLCSIFVSGQGREPMLISSVDSLPEQQSVKLTLDGIVEQNIKGDLKRARRLYQRAIKADSLYAPPYYYLSDLYPRGSVDSALLMARSAYLLDSTNHWYTKRYAFFEINAGSVDRAIELYQGLMEGSGADIETYQQMALARQRKGDFLGAVEVLDSAQSRFGFNPSVAAMQLEIYAKRVGDVERAEALAHRLLDLLGADVEMRLGVISLLFTSGLDSMALEQTRAMISLDEADIRPRLLLIEWYESKGDYPTLFGEVKQIMQLDNIELDYKLDIFDEFIDDINFYATYRLYISELAAILWGKYPDSKRVLDSYTQHLIYEGRFELIAEIYNDLVDKQNYAVYDNLEVLLDVESYLKRAESVERRVREGVKHYPDSLSLYPRVGYVYHFVEDYQSAADGFKWAIAKSGGDSESQSSLWGALGDCYQELAKRSDGGKASRNYLKRCYQAYDKSIAINSLNSLTLNNYAYALTQYNPDEKGVARALVMSTRANSLKENIPSYIDTQAYILFLMGNLQEAKTLLQQAIALEATNGDILFHYAEVLAALGEYFLSEVYFERALAAGYSAEAIELKIEELKQLKAGGK